MFTEQLASMKETDSPDAIIDSLCIKLSQEVATAVDRYLRSADVEVGPTNLLVMPTTGSATVKTLLPAKLT